MSLPKRPPLTDPIPNEKIAPAPEQFAVKAPYWDAILEGDLTVDADGKLALIGGEGDGDPNATVKGAYGSMPLGPGLTFDGNALQITQPPYIYCTPAYPELPPSSPPYSCETEVNTAGVTDFTDAWRFCNYLTEFPCVDSSAVTDFGYSWAYCSDLTSFPAINTGNGVVFDATWRNCQSLTSFPLVNVEKGNSFYYTWYDCPITEFPEFRFVNGENFYGAWSLTAIETFPNIEFPKGIDFGEAWAACSSLSSFPPLDLRKGQNFDYAWQSCPNLTSFPEVKFRDAQSFNCAWQVCTNLVDFPAAMFNDCNATNFASAWNICALSQQSVDNILVSINAAGQSNGTLGIDGGTSAEPGTAGLAAKAALEARGWTVLTN